MQKQQGQTVMRLANESNPLQEFLGGFRIYRAVIDEAESVFSLHELLSLLS